ncbi:hypothetical protein Q9Q95_12930 [Sphingomonas sp. DG1-23]|uniref:hypothetical protein n=1 Tax=Sphingomonas sp. DG1-23 TaxID=3068316 RepID=UPI00273E759A|nr:hypothetical protein [Sphingomonas sp. DG1-23]MDP5279831.1 hypothetical protein [Sphingomonas sp. DG1-23]
MSVRLHIERLVVDAGLGAAGTDGQILRESIQAELTRLLTEQGPTWTSADAWRVEAPGVAAQRSAEALGAEVARALHGSVQP